MFAIVPSLVIREFLKSRRVSDNMFSLANICTNGRIEFLQKDRAFVKRIFGEELDVNAQLFKVV